jgi:hypothetical protein
LAELFDGADTPAFGIVGMGVKMDKIHGFLTTEAPRAQRFFSLSREHREIG